MTADECDRCGCRARTHPIDTCRTFVSPAHATAVAEALAYIPGRLSEAAAARVAVETLTPLIRAQVAAEIEAYRRAWLPNPEVQAWLIAVRDHIARRRPNA